MNRLGLLPPSSLSAEQKAFYDEIDRYLGARYNNAFITKLDDGSYIGPFGVLMHTPEVGRPFMAIPQALAKIPGLSSRNREIAILVVGGQTQAKYEEYAHQITSKFPQADLDMLHNGTCPPDFDNEGKIVFKTAMELFKPGPLDAQTWKEAVEALGVSGATALVHYVGFYKYTSTLLNGFDVQLPPEDNK